MKKLREICGLVAYVLTTFFDREETSVVGAENTEKAWILSDRDVWYRNPYYTGPAMPHPEEYDPEFDGEWEEYLAAYRANLANPPVSAPSEQGTIEELVNDCPF